jgi:HK97 family phage major capsid protein
VALDPESVRAYRSATEPDHYNVTKAVGQKAIGSLTQAKSTHRKAITGMSESVPADGGFLVQTDWGGSLMERAYDTSMLARMVDTTPISGQSNGMTFYAVAETSRADGSRRGGIRYYWVPEGGEKEISHPTYRKVELQLNKIVVRVPATDELLQDTAALENEILTISGEEIGFGIDDSIINGTGAGMPLGILASPALIPQAAEAGQAAATVVSENIINMWSRRWVRYRDYVWLINQDVLPQLLQMNLGVGTGGQLTYMPPGGLSGQPYGTLMGRPVIEHESCQTLGTQGDIILWSPSSYKAIEKGGLQTASSIHIRWVYDETEFRTVYRYDGQPKWNLALTPYNSTVTQGPMIVLETRS